MTISVGEIGKLFRMGVYYDMSGSIDLTLKFTSPDGSADFTVSAPAVTAPAVSVVDPDVGPLDASTYFQYTTTGVDFTVEGEWSVCGIYEDAAPSRYSTTEVEFTVLKGCG